MDAIICIEIRGSYECVPALTRLNYFYYANLFSMWSPEMFEH